ncbi:MAG: hypothetical protein EOM19_01230 [Candidatus Moranbacteria bacterium]|nr:hypothetical protein [Candidatus Moranbacteria bacterium]
MYLFSFKTEVQKKIFPYHSILIVLLICAFFLRILWIDTIPAGIYPDEAVNGTDALSALDNKHFQWFYENNYGREGLFINLISLSVFLFGNTILGLKFWSIIIGTLSVLGIYLLSKELFSSRLAGIISAFLMTFSFWALNFSRISFRAIFIPLILSFSFYFLFKGLRTKKYIPFIFAGLIFGLGFHTYIAFRLAPFILIIIAIVFLLNTKKAFSLYWKHALVFLGSLLFTTFPIVFTFFLHPEYFSSRSASISIFSPEIHQGAFLKTLGETFTLSMGKYFIWGDQNWRHNLPPFPILDFITVIAFASGLLWFLFRWLLLTWKRFYLKEYNKEYLIISFILAWFFIMLAPEFLTREGLPHALRAIGTQPPVFIMAMFPLLFLFRLSKKDIPLKRLYSFLAPTLLLLIAFLNIFFYFVLWGQSNQARDAFDRVFTQQAFYLRSLPTERFLYVLGNGPGRNMSDGLPVSAHVIRYLTWDKENVSFLYPETIIKTPATFILMRNDEVIINKIKNYYKERATIETVVPPKETDVSFTVIHID